MKSLISNVTQGDKNVFLTAMNQTIAILIATFFGLLTFGVLPVEAFTLIKNVNSGVPLEEKLVIFDKLHSSTQLIFSDLGTSKTVVGGDGALESQISGNEPVKVLISWKAGGSIPDAIDLTQYGYLVLTCRLEGTSQLKMGDGKFRDTPRRGNLYFCVVLYDASGAHTAYGNLADLNEGETPDKTVTLAFPLMLFVNGAQCDVRHITAIGFPMDKTRAEVNRNFRLVIDKIALAK